MTAVFNIGRFNNLMNVLFFDRVRCVKKNAELKHFCAIWPSERSKGRIRQRIREAVGRRYSLSAGRVDKKTDTGNKGLEQLSQGNKAGAQATSQAQCLSPRTAANIPEAEVQ